MACRDDYEPTPEESRRSWELRFRHNSDLAEMLCSVLTTISDTEEPVTINHLSQDVQKWWQEHQERDRKKLDAERREAEHKQAVLAAYSKLTPEERKLLGLKKPF